MAEKPSLSDIMSAVSNLQSSMKTTQDSLKESNFIAKADAVEITLNGQFSCVNCTIENHENKHDNTAISKMVKDAINDAVAQIGAKTREHIEQLSSDLKNKE